MQFSFEYFPPKDPAAQDRLLATASDLGALKPKFVSVTYGAGGTTQSRTLGVLERMVKEAKQDAAGHLTCVGATREAINKVAKSYKAIGVNRIVALRGDPRGEFRFVIG